MTRTTRRLALGALACSLVGTLIAAAPRQDGARHMDQIAPSGLIAVVYPTEGNKASGVVRFQQRAEGVRVTARIEGLKPDSEHGFHIHEFGDASAPDGTSAGDHFNPEGHEHGLPPDSHRHAGDFGNLKANAQGVAEFNLTAQGLKLTGGPQAILGRAVIVHADPDDGSQPTGNAGARIGIGIIGIAQKGN
jgi:superoxide dismutase, Cu-Zn family